MAHPKIRFIWVPFFHLLLLSSPKFLLSYTMRRPIARCLPKRYIFRSASSRKTQKILRFLETVKSLSKFCSSCGIIAAERLLYHADCMMLPSLAAWPQSGYYTTPFEKPTRGGISLALCTFLSVAGQPGWRGTGRGGQMESPAASLAGARKNTVFTVFSGRLPGCLPDNAPLPPQNPAQTVHVGHSRDFSFTACLVGGCLLFPRRTVNHDTIYYPAFYPGR